MLSCSALFLPKSSPLFSTGSFFFLNLLLNCCYKAANVNGNLFSLFPFCLWREYLLCNCWIIQRETSLGQFDWRYSGNDWNCAKAKRKICAGNTRKRFRGLSLIQFTFKLKYNTTIVCVILVSDAECFSSLFEITTTHTQMWEIFSLSLFYLLVI